MSNEITINGNINAKQVAIGTNAKAIIKGEKDISLELKDIEKQIENLNLIFLDHRNQLNNVVELIELTSSVKIELKKDNPNKQKINTNLEDLAMKASSITVIVKAVNSLIETIRMAF